MGLYYSQDSYELKEIDDALVEEWRLSDNPKYSYYILAPQKPSEDSTWNNGEWIIPQIEVPTNISARQIRLWLIQHGISLQNVSDAINNIPDPIMREITLVEWEYAPYIERSHPMLVPLAISLGLSESQINQAFIEASNI